MAMLLDPQDQRALRRVKEFLDLAQNEPTQDTTGVREEFMAMLKRWAGLGNRGYTFPARAGREMEHLAFQMEGLDSDARMERAMQAATDATTGRVSVDRALLGRIHMYLEGRSIPTRDGQDRRAEKLAQALREALDGTPPPAPDPVPYEESMRGMLDNARGYQAGAQDSLGHIQVTDPNLRLTLTELATVNENLLSIVERLIGERKD